MSFGTDIDSLRAHNALSEPAGHLLDTIPCEPLNNVILIIWQQRNFRRENKVDGFRPLCEGNHPERFDDPQGIISDEVYERMKPALRLASAFHNLSRDFFVRIYRANVTHVHGTPVLDDHYRCKRTDVAAYTFMMQSLSQTMRIYTGFRDGINHAHYKASSASSTLDRIPQYEQLNSAYIDWYSRQDYDSQDAQKKNMIAFDLAVTLVHEHAHKVWQVRTYTRLIEQFEMIKRQSGSLEAFERAKVIEPWHSRRDWGSELGWSWERYFFGGLFPIYNSAEGTLGEKAMVGTSWMAWNDVWENAEPTMWVVAVRTYNEYFNRLAWDAEEESQVRPRQGTGATQTGGDDFASPLALYLTPLKVIKSLPVSSTGYAALYKKHLDAIAQGLHVNTVYHS